MMKASKPIRIKLSSAVELKLVKIKAGEFFMGQRGEYAREEPVHRVVISEDFYMGIYPVTQEQFAVFAQIKKLNRKNQFEGNLHHPVDNVSWDDADAFCKWIDELKSNKILLDYHADFPTEAQWEFACRGGTNTDYYTGDGEAALREAGWFDENSKESTHPVGSLRPNDFGLYDMHGNVWEWCRDYWDENVYKKRPDGVMDPDPDETSQSSFRVLRGGSWINSARYCRSAFRYWGSPGIRIGFLGFRVGLFPGPSQPKRAESATHAAKPEGRGEGHAERAEQR